MNRPTSPEGGNGDLPDDREEALAELVAICLAEFAEGVVDPPFDVICAERPDLKADVMRSFEKAARIPAMHARAAGSDRMVSKLIAGRYRISARVGSGAMGVVYAATDLDLGRSVAIKVMHGNLLDRSTAMARFDREASALAAVRHESVVTIHDRGVTDDGSPFLVMELIEGISCAKILEHAKALRVDDETGWLEETCGISAEGESSFLRQAVRWLADVASGLSAAHDAGVFHRDVKPSNIIVRLDGRAVLLDFGIAATEEQDPLTRSDAAMGTPAYMAPEMLKGSQKARPAQDVYGVAATFYHFLTLQPPYRGNSSEILTAVATREPVPALKIRPGLPRDAQAILDHGLSRNPLHRYSSVGAMETDLRALLAFRPVSVRPTSTMVRAVRRASRSKLFIGAVLATITIVASLVVHDTLARRRARTLAEQTAAYHAAWPGVPTNFPLPMGVHRGIAVDGLRDRTAKAFDALVASGHRPAQTHVLRAIFRLDHGDITGAHEDIRAFQRCAGSDFSRELLRRFAALDSAAKAPVEVDLSSMPEPTDSHGLYASTMFAFRRDGSTNYLRDSRLDEVRHIQVIRLLVRLERAGKLKSLEETPRRIELCEGIFDTARLTLEQSDYPGATLGHIMATARGLQRRFRDCLSLSHDVLAEAPASPATLLNAGDTARKEGLFDDARAFIERGLEITPGYVRMEKELALIEAYAGRYEVARTLVASTHFASSKSGALERCKLLAQVEATCTFQERSSHPAEAQGAALRLRDLCTPLVDSWPVSRTYIELARGVLEEDDSKFFRALLSIHATAPDSARFVGLLVETLPNELGETDTELLRGWLKRLEPELSKSQTLPLIQRTDPAVHSSETASETASDQVPSTPSK